MEATKTMRSVLKVLSISLGSMLLALSVAACSDGGSDVPNADDNRKVSSLTPADIQKVCNDARSAVTDEQKAAIGKLTCTISLTFGQAECTPSAVDACVKEFIRTPASGTCDLGVDKDKCDVTVGQLVVCEDAMFDQLVDATNKLTCENLLAPGTLPQQKPESCKIVEQKCPSAFDSGNNE